jgi:type II secretory pathway component PulK
MSRAHPQSGFALVMSLVLVMLAGVLLSRVAWRSASTALDAAEAAEELKVRWAVIGLRAAVLPRVESILDQAERGEQPDDAESTSEARYLNPPVAELRIVCRLSGIEHELVLTDEQAKLNVNVLLKERGRADTQLFVDRWLNQQDRAGGALPRIRLRPLPVDDNQDAALALSIGSFGQIAREIGPEQWVGSDESPGLSRALTLWGDGKLNLRRASASAIEARCKPTLGLSTVRALLTARKSDPYRKLSDLLENLSKVNQDEKSKIARLLTDESSCHGLWIVTRAATRRGHMLCIGVGDGPASGSPGGTSMHERYDYVW